MSRASRRRVADAIRQSPVWAGVQRKIDDVVAVRTDPSLGQVQERLDRAGDDLRTAVEQVRRALDERFDHLAAEIRRLDDDLRRFGDSVHGLREQCGQVQFDLDRLGPHVAALEVRIADRDRPEVPVESDDEQRAESRRLLDEVAREHERIRVRFSGLALYEERLRKLEEARWAADRSSRPH